MKFKIIGTVSANKVLLRIDLLRQIVFRRRQPTAKSKVTSRLCCATWITSLIVGAAVDLDVHNMAYYHKILQKAGQYMCKYIASASGSQSLASLREVWKCT